MLEEMVSSYERISSQIGRDIFMCPADYPYLYMNNEKTNILIGNKIFIERTANVGVLPMELAINYGCSGPVLRGSGLRHDLRKTDAYSIYPELDFEIPIGEGKAGTVGDCEC